MSFLSNISNAISGITTSIKSELGLTKTKLELAPQYKAVAAAIPSSSLATIEKIAQNPLKTAAVATFVTAPSATISTAKSIISSTANLVKNAYSSLAPTTKLAVTAAAVPVGLTVAKSSTLQKAIVNTPKSVNTLTTNVAGFIDQPSLASGKQIFSDNPVLASSLAGGAVLAAGYGASSLISNALNTAAVKENTKAMALSNNPISSAINQDTNKFDVKTADINAESALDVEKEKTKQLELQLKAQTEQLKYVAQQQPVTPTATAAATTTTKKKKATKKKAKKKTVKKKAKKKATKKKKPKSIKRKKKK